MSVAANRESLQREWEGTACAPVHEQPGRTLALLGRLIDILASEEQDGGGRPVGFVQHNGAGEIIFRQAGHPSNDPEPPWRPVYLR